MRIFMGKLETVFKVCNDNVSLSPVLDLYNREIISYCISLSPNLQQVREMLTGLIAKLPETATAWAMVLQKVSSVG